MFANGELRLQLPSNLAWTTQPSSAYYFFFAEFALLAIDLGVDVPVWSKLLNVLVRTQRMVFSVYKASVRKPGFGDYSPCSFDPGRSWPCSEREELRRWFRGLGNHDLCVVAARHAHEFVPGIAGGAPGRGGN